ncbi:MAG: Gfo/Idh/MocA family protein, partial [Thermomicrobiales bacterium]
MVKKIGIVGSDNSHAIAYSKLVNGDLLMGGTARVVGIWGQDPARTQEVATAGQIETIVDTPDGLLGNVDVVFVVDRHGDLHASHALPYLEAGIPVYVDKPFAISLTDCRQMLDAAKGSGAFITSMSSLRITPETSALAEQAAEIGDIRAAQFAGPCDFGSEYGGPFFYATHVLEIALRLLGDEIESIRADRIGQT